MPREWNTPVREPFNPVILQCLRAVDTHMQLFFKTRDPWHLEQAQLLRGYVAGLKTWIHREEGR